MCLRITKLGFKGALNRLLTLSIITSDTGLLVFTLTQNKAASILISINTKEMLKLGNAPRKIMGRDRLVRLIG